MSDHRSRHQSGFTLLEIMIVVGIFGILMTIAVPVWLQARAHSGQKSCQENLTKINEAKEQWAIENRKNIGDTPVAGDLYGETLYVRKAPTCPADGVYTIEPIGTDPSCSLSASDNHYLP